MVEPPLSDYEVVRFLVNRGGRCTNFELVSNFRGILNDPRHQAEARLKFKDIINTVATVGEFQNVKYIELKKEYCPSNYIKQQSEDSQHSGHSSLSSESSGASSYNSPLSQNFQPYWRYRLSTSPQLPPPRRPDVDSALRSPTSKTFNRSVSESSLQEDILPPPRTRSTRTCSEEEHQQQPRNIPDRGRPRMHDDNFRRSSSLSSPAGPSTESLTHQEDVPRYTSSHLPTEPPNSLPYCNPYTAIHKSRTNQDLRGGNVGLPVVTRSSGVPAPSPEVKANFTRRPDVCLSEMVKNRQFVGNESNFGIQHVRSRSSFDDSYLSQPESYSSPRNSYISRSPSSVESCEQYPFNRRGLDSSRSESSLSNRSSSDSQQRSIEMNWEQTDDVFTNPDYMRTVSKLCLERNKVSLSPSSVPDQQSKGCKTNKMSNIWPKDQLPPEALRSKSGIIRNEYSPNKPVSIKDVENIAPVPPERRRKSQDIPPKLSKDPQVNVEPTENVMKEVSSKVKDRVQHFDEMEKKQRKVVSNSSDKENRVSLKSTSSMEDDVSISVLDPKLKKEWFVKASQCDYHSLIALLKKEPKLAALKDIASGYTALHWAAKHGDANVVKLIAGAYKVNPNIRSNGGYTPVHLASLYKHDMIGRLLIHTYGADPSLRDYNGKRADQYPKNYVQTVAGQKNVERRPLKQRPLVAKEPSGNSFMRIGSLNLRKARKSTVFASVRGSNRNWGSASELRLGGQGSARKKVNKRESLFLDKKSVAERKDDSDSDSAYGFPSKKQES